MARLGRPPGPGGPYNRKKVKEVRAWAIVNPAGELDVEGIALRRFSLLPQLREGERTQRVKITAIP